MDNWISVDERLPAEISKWVLVARDIESNAPSVKEANLVDGKFYVWRFGLKQEFKNPTHWMPLPEPPGLTPDE